MFKTISTYIRLSKQTTRYFSTGETLNPIKKTALYDYHIEKGGKLVEFAGYYLPVQFDGLGVMKEHLATRAIGCATIFDVSHMGQIKWHGKDAVKFIEQMVVGDIASLKEGEAKLSLIMNEKGGIVDDTVITNAGSYIYMVVNGACKDKDMAHFNTYMKSSGLDVHMEYLDTQQLIALQGKGASKILSHIMPNVNFNKMNFMSGFDCTIQDIPNCRITRCGYTGEDGFEISIPYEHTIELTSKLMNYSEVTPAGLGARDSLRLEAGLCLYGNDLNEQINPVEANLVWTIGGPKSRRRTEQGFLGANTFLEANGKLKSVSKKRIGLAGMKAPARGHTEVFTVDGGSKIGEITSGGFGPTLGKPMAMGYVSTDQAVEGTKVGLMVRGKLIEATVTKMPFVPTDYFRVAV